MLKKLIWFVIFMALGVFVPQMVFDYRPMISELTLPIHVFVILITYTCGRKIGFLSIPLLLTYHFIFFDIVGYPDVLFLTAELLLYVYFISIFVHVTKHEFMNLIISIYISKFVVVILFFVTYSIFAQREIINVYAYSSELLWGFTHVPILSTLVWFLKKGNQVYLNEEKNSIEW